MLAADVLRDREPADLLAGVDESSFQGLVRLSPTNRGAERRLIYIDSYGGASMWRKIKCGDMPSHHLRGCLQLVRMGYEVLLAEPLSDFYFNSRAIPHDLRLVRLIRSWLGSEGVVFCGHNVLYWVLLLRAAGAIKCRIVSNLWAREPLNLAPAHSGIVALTRAGAEQAAALAPKVKVAPVGWGADLAVYPRVRYRPGAFFSCGIALRDFPTLSRASALCSQRIEVVVPGPIGGVSWPRNVRTIDGGKGWNFERKRLSYGELIHSYYARATASLIIVKRDDAEYTACGFTEIIEAMAMARPVIVTNTGALPSEIDVERFGCGIFVPPEDPEALAGAIEYIGNNPDVAEEMGRKGRALADSYYNIDRYARDLDVFFKSV